MCVKESDAPSGLVRVDYDDLVDSLYKFTPLEADDLVEAVTRHVEKHDKAQEGIRRDAFVSLSLRCLLETTDVCLFEALTIFFSTLTFQYTGTKEPRSQTRNHLLQQIQQQWNR